MLVQEIYSAFGFMFIICIAGLSHYLLHRIDVQVLSEFSEPFHPSSFIATRAYDDLQVLNDIGPKVTGSIANEVITVNYLLKRSNEIKAAYNNVSEITIDHQLVTGHHIISAYYLNVQNVVVKLHGKTTDVAVMINCHFDTEAGSPGASDDGVNCCIMLEALRVMAKSGHKNDYSVIFLFNGNEEGKLEGLQASHGFISQHKWAKDIKAFINLDSIGANGRELLARSGPKHSWLLDKYHQSVDNPFAQTMSEEIFESGLIKAGTDFETFRDVAHIPGLDMAYTDNTQVYHTSFDHIRYVKIDAIQTTGNHILKLLQVMANSNELLNPPEGSPSVYFDFLGFFFVSYSSSFGIVTNCIVSICAFFLPFLMHIEFKMKNLATVLKLTLISFFTFLISVILSLGITIGMGFLMNAVDNAMFWFNATILSIGVYSSLAIIIQIVVHHISFILFEHFISNLMFTERNKLFAQLNGVNLFWAILTITISVLGIRSSYITMLLLFISLCTNVLIWLLNFAMPKLRVHAWIFIHFFGHSFSFIWIVYGMLTLWKVLIGISEKTYNSNPELIISALCALMAILSLSYFIPLTSLVRNKAVLYSALIAAFVISVILSLTSPGFPYNGSIISPRVQRHYVTHTKRTFYDTNGNVEFTDIGFYILENERNSKRTLYRIFDPAELMQKDDDIMCITEAFCGFPSYNLTKAFWKKATDKPLILPSKLKMTSSNQSESIVEMNFSLALQYLTLLYVTLSNDAELVSSSKPLRITRWMDFETRYAKLVVGKAFDEPFLLSLKLNRKSSDSNYLVKVTVVTLDQTFDNNPMEPEFQNLVSKFPSYTFIQTHQADVSSYAFK